MDSNEANLPVIGRSKEDEPKANSFVIPPYIIAEAMSSLHGSVDIDINWSSPITPSEMRFVEQYVQARYPEYYGGAIKRENLPVGFQWKEDGETSEDGGGGGSTPRERRGGGFGSNRDYSPSFGNAPSELRTTKLEETSRLQELLAKRVLGPDDRSISVPEMHAKNRVLKFCGVTDDDYLVVFATAVQEAMRMVGESYPFLRYNCYMSVLEEKIDAIKEYAVHKEAKFIQAPASWLDLRIAGSQLSQHFRRKSKYSPKGLFAYPLEINGTRSSLHWVSEAQRSLWHVLLDCSDIILGDNNLVLNLHKPDFVLCSLYKVPNQPHKITCLLVRRNSFFITAPK